MEEFLLSIQHVHALLIDFMMTALMVHVFHVLIIVLAVISYQIIVHHALLKATGNWLISHVLAFRDILTTMYKFA